MSALVLFSIAVRIAVAGWAAWLYARSREFRIGALALLALGAAFVPLPIFLELSTHGPPEGTFWLHAFSLPGTALIVVAAMFVAGVVRERAHAQRDKAKAVGKLEAFYNSSAHIFWTLGSDFTFTYVSAGAKSLLGVEPERVLGQRLDWFMNDGDRDAVSAHLAQAQSGAINEATFEFCLPGPDQPRYLETHCVVRRRRSGEIEEIVGISHDVTDRRTAENAARAGEMQHRFLTDHAQDSIWETDLEGRVIYMSPATEQLLGYRPDELIGTKPQEHMLVQEAHDEVLRQAMAVLNGEQPEMRYEAEHVRKDGSRVWCEVRGTILRDEDGMPRTVMGVTRDISSAKAAALALAERADFESLISKIAARFITLGPEDVDAEITNALSEISAFVGATSSNVARCDDPSAAFIVTHSWDSDAPPGEGVGFCLPYAMVPWFTEELRKDHVPVMTTPDDLPESAIGERLFLEQEGVDSAIAVPLMRGDTLVGYLNMAMRGAHVAWSDENIALMRFLGTVVLNALDRQQVDREAAFRASMEGLLVEVSAGFINLHVDEFAGTINDVLVRLTELVDGTSAHIFLELPDESGVELTYHAVHGERQLPVGTVLPFESVRWLRDQIHSGEVVQVASPSELPESAALERAFLESRDCQSMVIVPLLYAGKIYGSLDIQSAHQPYAWPPEHLSLLRLFADVLLTAHLRREEEQARRALDAQLRQAQKMEAVGTLAGGIAHDFNNILTGILGGVDYVLAGDVDPDDAKQALQLARHSAGRASELTRQLLTLTRPEALRIGPVAVNDVVDETVHLLRRSLDATIDVQVDLDPDAGLIEGDSGQIEQALLNLGINARDAMPQGGVLRFETTCIEIFAAEGSSSTALSPGAYVRVRVSDTGVGISAAHVDHIFEPFFTTKQPGEGTGLGLAMVYNCVQAHAGEIMVSSDANGSCFDLYLPQSLCDVPDEQLPSAPAMAGSGRILFVDDEAPLRELGQRMLERCGYAVTVAGDGEEAIALFRQEEGAFDLVITDLTMPKSGGRDVLTRLRQAGAHVPVLLISGYGEVTEGRSLQDEAESLGFTGFLAKPFGLQQLADAAQAALASPVA